MKLFNNGYALVVGVANYSKVRALPATVVKDAQDFSQLLTAPAYCGYPTDQVRVLTDHEASAEGIRDGLRWLAQQAGEDDTVVFFFSGHGGRSIRAGGSPVGNYLMPVDGDPQNLHDTALESAELTTLLQKINAGRLLAIFDCCHAGAIGQAKEVTTLPEFKFCLDEEVYARLSEGQGRVIIASSRSNEVSLVLADMKNSLFTHYLLKALRGEAQTRGDGLVRIWDVFEFTAQNVTRHDPRQHPVIKANLESNFPVCLYLGGKIKMNKQTKFVSSNVTHSQNVTLPDKAKAILDKMFARYQSVVVKKKFDGGFSRGEVFMVRPVGQNRADLPAIVKMGPASMIEKEWHAFQKYIHNRVPNVAIIEGEPVYHQDWAGIRYPLVGDGVFTIESLRDYCQQATIKDIRYVLDKQLFKSLRKSWLQNQVKQEFSLQRSYDPVLPFNLVLEQVQQPQTRATLHLLNPQSDMSQLYNVGDYVWLSGFRVSKINEPKNRIYLNLPSPSPEDGLPRSYAICLQGVTREQLASYPENQIIKAPIMGVIRETRQTLLEKEVQKAVGTHIDWTAETLPLANGIILPNPLLAWPAILNHSLDVRVADIHGDLNMQNVLVKYESRNIQLIDFANSRLDHILHDLLRLETEVLLHLVPPLLSEANLPQTIHTLYERLHDTLLRPKSASAPRGLEKPFAMLKLIRRQARTYLLDPTDWDEYYNVLIIYLLGALKFSNLDHKTTAPLPKQTVFWGAATILKLLNAPSQEDDEDDEEHEIATEKLTTKPTGTSQPETGKRGHSEQQNRARTDPIEPPNVIPVYRDTYTPYQIAMRRLLEHMGRTHDRYADALLYQQQLEENIKNTRRYRNTRARSSERSEIIDQLNELSLLVTALSFIELSQQSN